MLFSFNIEAKTRFEEPWGEGSSIKNYGKAPSQKSAPMTSIAGHLFEGIISFHAEVISPVDGPRSHYRPTSSRYMLLSMRKYGILYGFIKGCDRLIRENNEKWVYRMIEIGGIEYKYDPT